MDFRIKNACFRLMEMLPFGSRLYLYLQQNVTKSIILSEERFLKEYEGKVRIHELFIEKYGKTGIKESTFFEFGAGWNLLAPIGFSIMGGCKRYIVVDLNEYARAESIWECLRHYSINMDTLLGISNCAVPSLQTDDVIEKYSKEHVKEFLKDNLGIEYLAPCDAGNTGLEDECIDYVISNATLEHIPKYDIERILQECNRIMKPGSIMSVTINYSDHWSYADKKLNPYSYMRYSDIEWEKYNPHMHYQNRLRHSDYRKMFTQQGFVILEEKTEKPGHECIEMLKGVDVSEKFKTYEVDDLLIARGHFVVRKPEST